MTDRSLAGRVAVVTGAAQGIGEAYAVALGDHGMHVVVADIDHDKAAAVAERICASGASAMAVRVDVADEQSAKDMAAATLERFGRLDVLVNNAAIFHSMRLDGLMDVPVDYWERVLRVNLTGTLLATRACVPAMRERGWGRIVNQSSITAFLPGGHYNISKLGVVGLTVGLAEELAPYGITVNCIAPGSIATEANVTILGTSAEEWERIVTARQLVKRPGQPDDLTRLLLFLIAEEAEWITSQTFCIDGGRLIRRL